MAHFSFSAQDLSDIAYRMGWRHRAAGETSRVEAFLQACVQGAYCSEELFALLREQYERGYADCPSTWCERSERL